MAIDDPLEKIRQIANEENSEFFEKSLQVAGSGSPLFRILVLAKGIVDKRLNGKRRHVLLSSLNVNVLGSGFCSPGSRNVTCQTSRRTNCVKILWFALV
jgi:hypothetical protein